MKDGDGARDLEDPGCSGPADPLEQAGCEDGVDNDADGLIDLLDPGCASAGDPDERSPGLACDDGLDNDLDRLADLADPGCSAGDDLSERSSLLACDDGIDNDGDGLVDLADPQCVSPLSPREATACGDTIDNDGDGLVDVADPGCADSFDESERSPTLVCDDGIDNDGDGRTDVLDPGCDGPDGPSEVGDCEDAADNDGDGLVDLADPGCDAASDASEHSDALACDDGRDNDEDGTIDLADGGCDDPGDTSERRDGVECDDGIDGDGDGLVDFPMDPGCSSASDPTEFNLRNDDMLLIDPRTRELVLVEAGSGARTTLSAGKLQNPVDLTIDDQGRIFVLDLGLRPFIIEIDPATGAHRAVALAGIAPTSLAADRDGGLIVTDPAVGTILRIDPETGASTIVSTGEGAANVAVARTPMPEPGSLWLLAAGAAFLACAGRRRLR